MPNDKKKDGFIMQAGILAMAGIIVRIIGLLYNTPLVAIIGDEGNGYYNSAYYAYSIVLLISSYSIPSAVSKVIAQRLATKEYRNAHRIFCCAFIYVLVVGGIASLFVFFGAGFMVKMESAVLPLRILAPTIFFSGILGVLRGYFQAHKTMVQTSVSQIVEQLVNAGVSIGMAYVLVQAVADKDATTQASFGAAGATIGTGAGVLAGLLFMLGVFVLNRKTLRRRIKRDTVHQDESYGDIFKMIFLVVTPFILSTGIYNINNFMDNRIYQQIMMGVRKLNEAAVAADLSVVSKGTKIANIPIAFASAMSTALIPGISSDFVQGKLRGVREKVAKAVKVTMLISIPCAVGIGVLAKPVMMVIFPQPDSLEIASLLLSGMAVSIVFYGLSTLTQGILQSIGRMKAPIINASVAVVLHGAVMVLMMLFLDERYSLYYYVFATVLYAFILCVLNQISVHRHLVYRQEFFRTFFLPVIASTIMGAAAFGIYQGVYYISKSNILALGLAAALGALIYFVLMIRSQAVSEEELRGMPKGHMLLALARKLRILKPQGGKPQGEPQREPQEEPPRGGKKTNAGAGGSGKRKAAKAKGKKAGKGSKKKNGGRNASAKKQKSAKLSKETQQIKGVTVTTQTRRLYQEQMDEDDDDFWLDD